MSRRARKFKRLIAPDLKFDSVLVSKFINKVMMGGKKSIAAKIVYSSLDELAKKVEETPIEAFEKVIRNVAPSMEVRSRRVGGSTYQVPVEVRKERSISLSLRWLVASARSRSGKTMVEKLTAEFIDAHHNTGTAVKKREDTHKMAEANKAFAHFRW